MGTTCKAIEEYNTRFPKIQQELDKESKDTKARASVSSKEAEAWVKYHVDRMKVSFGEDKLSD